MILKFELNLTRLISYTNIFLLQTYIFIFEDICIFNFFNESHKRIFFLFWHKRHLSKIILCTRKRILYKNTKSYADFRCLGLPIFRRRCCSHSLTLKPSSYASAAEENAAIMCRRRPCKRKREACFIYLVQGFPDVRYYFPSSNAFRRSRRLNAAMNAKNQTSEKFLKNSPAFYRYQYQ